jgi:DNA repair protein RecN (Recombination protein N)
VKAHPLLLTLRVENLGPLGDVKLEPGPGLTVVTGESGAGKSLLIGSLDLLSRPRAAGEQVGRFGGRARVTAAFDVGPDWAGWEGLSVFGVEPDDILTIQREWGREGRSTSRVQGQPVPLAVVRTLMTDLVDVTSQHAAQRLMAPGQARRWLDALVPGPVRDAVEAAWQEWKGVERAVAELEKETADEERVSRWREDVAELEALRLRSGEEEQLARDVERLTHQERLAGLYREALAVLEEAPSGLVAGADRLRRALGDAARYDVGAEAAASLSDDLAALAGELRHQVYRLAEAIDLDATRLEEVRDRLDKLARAARRFGVGTPSDLIALLADRRRQLAVAEDGIWQLGRLAAKRDACHARYEEVARTLTEARRAAAAAAAEALAPLLSDLDMPGAALMLAVEPGEPSASGVDEVSWRFRPAAGQDPLPLDRVASGGELSRVALALAVVQREPTVMVLDEVDAGLGGGAALRVRDLLRRLAEAGTQVLVVSHQAVVAACADSHWRMAKRDSEGATEAVLTRVEGEDRVHELARMLSGSDAGVALQHARQLMAGAG